MKKKILHITLAVIVVITGILCANPIFTKANEDSSIFSLEKDGYWKPSDAITREFIISNTWNQKCYLDGFIFSNSYIKDLSTDRQYSVKEAIDEKIIDDYNVSLSIKDEIEGNEVLFSGGFNELINTQVKFSKPIYMNLDKQIKFSISISFDPKAGNEYQNKSYEFIISCDAHKTIYSITDGTVNWPDISNRYIDKDGNWRTYGYYDDKGDWHKPGYWDKDGIFHEDLITVPKIVIEVNDKVTFIINKYFKTSDENSNVFLYEIMTIFFSICIVVIIIIRGKASENK